MYYSFDNIKVLLGVLQQVEEEQPHELADLSAVKRAHGDVKILLSFLGPRLAVGVEKGLLGGVDDLQLLLLNDHQQACPLKRFRQELFTN